MCDMSSARTIGHGSVLCRILSRRALGLLIAAGLVFLCSSAPAATLEEVRKAGCLRHLGIPYANFVTGLRDGMDVELMQQFAAYLGVRYEYVKTDWTSIFGDLTGRKVTPKGDEVILGETMPIRGDVAANGITVLEWRRRVVDFSLPTFPNQVWLMARADAPQRPIKPSGQLDRDIEATRGLIAEKTLLCKPGTCLDGALYHIEEARASVQVFNGGLNDMAPALLGKEADLSLLDVPDALVAMMKWPGQLKVIGPISPPQEMAVAFAKNSTDLKDAFNRFLTESSANGLLEGLVKKYYPYVLDYYPDFFTWHKAELPSKR